MGIPWFRRRTVRRGWKWSCPIVNSIAFSWIFSSSFSLGICFVLLTVLTRMPLLNGYEATERIRALEAEVPTTSPRLSHQINGRLPIFAVSASLFEEHREEMSKLGIDGWILKPIDFKRLRIILTGVTDPSQREKDLYRSGCNWEIGGWLTNPGPLH